MEKNRLPTILALIFLILGIAVGVMMVESKKIFQLRAMQGIEPKFIRVSNVTDTSFTVSWTTDKETVGQTIWGETLTSMNKASPSFSIYPNYTHSVTVDAANPTRDYYFKIISNGVMFDSSGIPWKVTTASPIADRPKANIISGIVTTETGMPIANALVYVNTAGGSLLSTTTEKDGGWTLALSQARLQDGSNFININENTVLELSVFAGPFGMATAQTQVASAKPLPTIRLGGTYNFSKKTPPVLDVPKAQINF